MNIFETLKHILNLKTNPVGVKLIYEYNKANNETYSNFEEPNSAEGYCGFVKRASQGEFLKLQKRDFSCKTAEIMLGFEKTDNIELTMRLDFKGLTHILLFPVNKHNSIDYDSVILIVNPQNCMNIIKAYVNLYHRPLKITCGVISGVCSEVTAYVIKRDELNFSFLCSNSRKDGVFSDCELLCGIPYRMVNDLIKEIIQLTH